MTTSGEAGISSTTAPAPRHSPRAAWHPDVRPIRLRGPLGSLVGAPGATSVGLMGLAVALAIRFWMIGDQPVIFDADNYVFHANILAHGPLSSWGFRTYGYPVFVLPWLLLVGGNTDALRGWIFVAQLAVHLGASWFFARRVAAAFQDDRLGRATYVLVVLNPFLLIMTGLLLSDLLSAALIAICAGLLLPSPGRAPAAVLREGMLSLALLAFSVEVRPANAVLLPVGTALWLAQWWLAARPDRRRFAVGLALVGAVAALPFIPQVALNLVAHGAASPLVVNSLYGAQLIWGMQSLKYATFVLRDYPMYPAVFYVNPFDPGQPSLRFFAETNPLGLAATWALHAFGLFDQDYPFPFVRETDGWYRWPLSILGYLLLWAAALGLVTGWRRCWRPGTRFAWSVLAMMSAAYVVVYLPTAVECRFGLPLFVLLAPAVAETVLACGAWARRMQWRPLAISMATAALTVAACASLSTWMQAQAPAIVAAREIGPAPGRFFPYARFETSPPDRWTVDQRQSYVLRLTNQGEHIWRPASPGQIVYHVMFVGPGDAETIDTRIDLRQPIAREVRPGDQVETEVTLTAPRQEGQYRLRQQLELDGLPSQLGSPPVDTAVTVDLRRRR